MTDTNSSSFWSNQYKLGKTGWDIGYASPPIVKYINQIEDKNLKILIPGAGKGWEVEYIFKFGFKNVFYLDFSSEGRDEFKIRCPDFPDNQIITDNFFAHQEKYDLIIEQTFFSSLKPSLRHNYVEKVSELLNPNGKLCGLLFKREFPFEGPPFGGNKNEYKNLFKNKFKIRYLHTAHNSIKPRKGNELFILMLKS
ncbi:MAG: SAM-dependent methyltransferase [Marinilabiliales bacterium]|nr:MAG: SAM-dependent methyltransferase [Marinilabiliales bacterium]